MWGFSVLVGDSDAEFKIYAPLQNDCSPFDVFRSHDYSAILWGRLYYVDDALSRLKVRDPRQSWDGRAPNAALATETYRFLGVEGLTKLEGDYALVIWDVKRRTLIAIRDPLGGYPLFWTKRDAIFGIGTTLRPLRALSSSSGIDREYVADYLMAPGPVYEELHTENSVYEGIQRVPSGCWLGRDFVRGETTIRRYWDWLAHTPHIEEQRLTEMSEIFCEALGRSVAERALGKKMCHLSGGFDSTAVTLLARSKAVDKDQRPEVHTISLIYNDFSNLRHERSYIDSVLKLHPE